MATNMKPKLTNDVLQALAEADRAPGWNNRSRDVRRFDIAGDFGRGCILYVVPFRRWAYRRQELATAAYWREQA
jgi:hypothetical protein